jgi:two-component system KDP operon response regulator KdpE
VLSGRTDSTDKVEALDAGADDYMTKPFPVDELLARIRALTRRRTPQDAEPVVTFGGVTIDLASRTAQKTGTSEHIHLTRTEWAVLELLLTNPDKLLTRQDLLHRIWGPAHVTDTGYLRLYIAQLRKKLEPEPGNPQFLLTEAGMGYRFRPDQSENQVLR